MVPSGATSAQEFETIGKYKILGEIGRGAMGVVYKAHDPVLNRLVAVKTIAPSLDPGTDDTGKRFLREAQSAARLNHPNIVTVYDLGEEQGRAYLAMELLQGRDLRQLIGSAGLVQLEDKLRIMEQVCEGVAFAHSKDVVHRDLKPANIHVQPNGSVKIMDFGLARIGASELTATGTSLGTPNYMSPEQVRGAKADLRSDVFSLGAVFYEMLTNHKAFDADSMASILRCVAESEPAPPRRFVPDLPAILVRLLERALDKDPARRFRSAGEMRLAFAVADQVIAGQLEESEGLLVLEPSESDRTAILEAPSASGASVGGGAAPGTEHTARDLLRRGLTLSRMATQPRLRTGIGRGSSITRRATKPRPSETLPPVRAEVAPPSRAPLLLGAGAALLLIVGGAIWVLRGRTQGPPPSPPVDIRKEQVGALTEALATSQVELAQESLNDKDYARAVSQAGQALKLEPQNAEARQILDKVSALLKEVDEAAAQARAAVQQGDTATASRALARVLAIDPNHPVAGELSAGLNRYFRGQAEEARKGLEAARLAAERGKAGALPPFVEASASAREAERLFTGAEYAVATRKFIEGRDGFARALRLAEAQQAAARTPPTTVVASATPHPPAAFPIPPPTAAPTPVAAATLAPSAPPSLALPLGGAAEEATVRKAVEDYARAIQAKDIDLFRAVKPNLSADEEKRLRAIFKQYKSYKVSITVNSIRFEGSEAKVRVARQDTIDGNAFVLQQVLTMARGPGGWTIREIGQ
ncbi:MAG: protein kinase [Solirubrobacterales bacterium]